VLLCELYNLLLQHLLLHQLLWPPKRRVLLLQLSQELLTSHALLE